MSGPTSVVELTPEKQAIRDKCFHPSDMCVEFPNEEIEQSIPERFEEIVRLYPDYLAVKTDSHAVTYARLNAMANRVAHAIVAERGNRPEPIGILLGKGVEQIAHGGSRADASRWLFEDNHKVVMSHEEQYSIWRVDRESPLGWKIPATSLAATSVVSRVLRKFQLELPLQSLFQSPAVAAAAVIMEHQGKRVGRMLGELELLSDEEATRLLTGDTASRSGGDRNG